MHRRTLLLAALPAAGILLTTTEARAVGTVTSTGVWLRGYHYGVTIFYYRLAGNQREITERWVATTDPRGLDWTVFEGGTKTWSGRDHRTKIVSTKRIRTTNAWSHWGFFGPYNSALQARAPGVYLT